MSRCRILFTCAAILALAGCSSEPPPPVVDVQAEVDDILVHFANPSESERWRGKLVEVAQRGPQQLKTTLASMDREYMRSWRRGGSGASGLDNAGRRRVMEVLLEIGDSPGARALLTKGLKDDEPNVVAAAAHGLAKWGDGSGLEPMLKRCRKTEGPGRKHLKGALKLLGKQKARETLLNAHTGDDALLFDATLATFPGDKSKWRAALQTIAQKHKNQHARKFAIQALSSIGGADELAKDALHNPATRGAALKALEKSGDAAGLAAELETEPDDADRVARHLYRIKSTEAAEAAGEVLGGDAGDDLRLILLQEFYGKAGEERPDVYTEGDGHEAVVVALRAAIERESGQAQRVVAVALGQLGDPGEDEGALMRLQGQSTELDRAVLVGLGHLGGEAAAAQLMHTLESNPELVEAAGAGLIALAKGGHEDAIPGEDLIVLLDHEEQGVREQALSILTTLAGSKDARGYKAAADAESRKAGVEAWQAWWDAR